MPGARYDVAVIGAGHNSLVAAAYLARAGRSVVVLERSNRVGGAVATTQFAPGFRAPVAFPDLGQLHPELIDELGLVRQGFKLLPRDGATLISNLDGPSLLLDGAPGTALSDADAHALQAFQRFLERVGRFLAPLAVRGLPPLDKPDLGDRLSLLGAAWRLRGLGRQGAPEALRLLSTPLKDALDERFESEPLKAAIAGLALTGSWLAPRSAGSTYGLVHHRPAWLPGLFTAPPQAAGGPGALSTALAAAAGAAGAVIRTGAPVRRIVVDEGAVRGLELESGGSVEAARIVAGTDPQRTLLELIDPRRLDADFAAAVRRLRVRGSVAIVKLALDRLPQFATAGGEHVLRGRIQIGASLDALERAFDVAKYGRPPEEPWLTITLPSLTDPSLAPPGKAVMFVWVQYAADRLRETSWDRERDALGDRVLAQIEAHAPGITASVMHREIVTPQDLQQQLGLTHGCLYHADLLLEQLLYMRPVPGWYGYRMPVAGLYLCGAGCHAGGGVNGLPGRNAARRLLADG